MSAPTKRIPNILHLLYFLTLTLLALVLCEGAVLLALGRGMPIEMTLQNERAQLFVNALTYLLALLFGFFAMPIFWDLPFLTGLRWNATRARWWLGLLGLLLGFAAQGITIFLPHPKALPIEEMFRHIGGIWLLAFFAVLLGPLFEEVIFRGFLLPAVAIAVDYARIPRDPDPNISLEHLHTWRASAVFSPLALTIASIVTSILFALIHAPQLGWTWPAILLLASVSAVLCVVRIRTGSVAASTLVHSCYNLSVFLTLFLSTGGFRHLDRM